MWGRKAGPSSLSSGRMPRTNGDVKMRPAAIAALRKTSRLVYSGSADFQKCGPWGSASQGGTRSKR